MIGSRLATSRPARSAVGLVARLTLLLAIIWAFAGPVDQVAMVAGVSAAPPPARQANTSQDSGFAVADGPIGNYFAARGGVRTFGPPVSNAFPLMGDRVQIFRDFVLKQDANGNVSTINLFDMGGIPFRNIGGRIIPEVDPALAASAPQPGTPEYGTRVQQFIRASAPDSFDGAPVGFYQAFIGTVQYEDAFPNGGERSLLAGFDQEVWGLPVSQPMRDAQDPDIILLRWERGVMVWSKQTGTVSAVPLGDTFKSVLTGQGLGPERTAAATGSPFLLQMNADAANGVARPGELPDTDLTAAFQPGAAAVAAAQMGFMTATPTPFGYSMYGTPTPTPYGYTGYGTPTPTSTPYGYQQPNYAATQQASQYQTGNPQNGYQTGTQTPYPYQPGNQGTGQPGSTTGLPGAINSQPGQPTAPQGSDPCYGDEQITFAPEVPRVANEVLIAVTSHGAHPYGRLAGTEKTNFVRERQGQLGYVWEWTIQLSYPGQHEYTFYVDSTIPCKKVTFDVRESLATKTPKPTKTATPYNWNNNNGNDDNGNNNNSNDNNNGSPPYRDPYQFTYSGDAYNCSFFYSQGEAQRVLRANPSDPNNLDAEDGVTDGIACTTYHGWQYPNDGDYNVVARTGVATPTQTNGSPPYRDPYQFVNSGDAYNCSSFYSQGESQRVLRASPSDPNNLDTESGSLFDGIACTNYSSWQYPNDVDYNAVSRTGSTPTPVPTLQGTATPIGAFNPYNYLNQGDAYNCIDFNSQADTQAVLAADPNDPNQLDISGKEAATAPHAPDGIACDSGVDAPEWASMFYYPEPWNKTPVPTPNGGRKPSSTVVPVTPTATPAGPTPTPVRGLPTSVTNNSTNHR
jgi:hypothetical protein